MLQRRFWTHVTHLAFLGTLAVAAGCAGAGPTIPTEDEPAVEEQAKAAEAEGSTRDHGKGGPERLLRAALDELQLSAEQRAAIQSALDTLHPADRASMKSVFSTLAAGVRAGKLDDAAIQTELDAAGKAAADHRAKVVAAVQKLHDTLTAEQRGALVSSIEKRVAERGGHEGKSDRAKKHGKDGAHGPAARLLHGVDLSDAQRERVQRALADAGVDKTHADHPKAEMRAKGKAMLDAFAKDRFDASVLVPEPKAKLEGVVKAVKAIVPVLDEAQRAKLAENLERGPKHHGGKRGHAREG